jgi:GT2 family glycosyltransferase
MPAPRCTVIIVNYNGKRFLRDCLASLRQQTVKPFDILLVDNGSSDGSADYAAQTFPEIRTLALPENLGFCKANNLGIRDALSRGCEYVLLLNNDTIAAPDFLEHMFAAADDDQAIAAVCPKIFFAHRPHVLWYAGADFNLWMCRSRYMGAGKQDASRFDSRRSITQATGCAMLVRASAIQRAGVLDERFWAYVEDLDWTIRFRRQGYRIIYEPRACLWHHDGGTTVTDGSQFRRQYLTTRNLLLLCREHVRWWQLPSFLLGFLVFHVGFYACLRLKQSDLAALAAIYRAILDTFKPDSPIPAQPMPGTETLASSSGRR